MHKKNKITPKERYRISKLYKLENELNLNGYEKIAGIDEVGRGCLAGPVIAAACILPKKIIIPKINDSKKLSSKEREEIFNLLKANKDVVYSIGIVEVKIIDQINIFQASLLAMKKAIQGLKLKPDFLLFDGKHHPLLSIPSQAVVKGDALVASIAAASIIAKVLRDNLMEDYHSKYPVYGFDLHKGYGTEKHKRALIENGPCDIHRKSYEPVKILS